MGDISSHFSSSEFECNCNCGFDDVDTDLIVLLETIYDVVADGKDNPIRILVNSGCRCEIWNRSCGGSQNSQHLLGTAADISVEELSFGQWKQIDASLIWAIADGLNPNGGVGLYDSFTHVDSRDGRARW